MLTLSKKSFFGSIVCTKKKCTVMKGIYWYNLYSDKEIEINSTPSNLRIQMPGFDNWKINTVLTSHNGSWFCLVLKRICQTWNHAICPLEGLVSFTQHDTYEIHVIS